MNVMIVDDDALLCFILRKQMARYAQLNIWEVAENGQDALEILHHALETGRALPEMILLDINMPVMNGWEFLEAIEHDKAINIDGTCICILSSSINKDDQNRSLDYSSVKHFFIKPLRDEDLENLVDICTS